MALELKRTFTQKADGTEVYIEVVAATGLYNVTTNPGGFGAPNPARNTLALIFYGFHKKSDGDVVVAENTHDPLTVSQYTIPMAKDKNGHLEGHIFALRIFDSIVNYVDGDIVYDNENPAAPFIKKRVAGVFVAITEAALIGEVGVVDALEINEFPVPPAQDFVNELNADQLEKLRAFIKEDCGRDDYEEVKDRFDYVDSLLAISTDDFAALAYNEAQLKVKEIFDYQDILENAS